MTQSNLIYLIGEWDRLCRITDNEDELNEIELLIEKEAQAINETREFTQEEIDLMTCTSFDDLM